MMRIGTMVSHREDLAEIKERLIRLNDMQIDNCQFNSWGPAKQTKENAVAVTELFREHGVTPSALWCGWEGPAKWNFYEGYTTLGIVPAEWREIRVGNLLHGSEFCGWLGLNHMISHMGYIPENPNDPEYEAVINALRRIAEPMEARGQYLLFETGQETPVTLLRAFADIGTHNLGVNLDTANLILYGKANPVDALDVIGKYVMGVHAKDGVYPTDGHYLGKEVAIGKGKVDFPALIRRLHELGYDGPLTIEREISGEQQKADIIAAKVYLEGLIASL